MKTIFRLLAASALGAAAAVAAPASAQTYNFSFGSGGSTLNGQFTAVASTGTTKRVTSISGTYMGQTITGLIGNPYSPSTAFYATRTGAVTADVPDSDTTDYYYSFDNLLLSGNTVSSDGFLFRTASNLVNLYTSGGSFNVISTPVGRDVAATGGAVTGSITQAVPEPATWAMMILGMGAVGYAMRRRRTTTRVAYAA